MSRTFHSGFEPFHTQNWITGSNQIGKHSRPGCKSVLFDYWNYSSGDKPPRDTQSTGRWTKTRTPGTHTQPFPRIPGSSHLHQDTSESPFLATLCFYHEDKRQSYYALFIKTHLPKFKALYHKIIFIAFFSILKEFHWPGIWLPGSSPLVRKCFSSLLRRCWQAAVSSSSLQFRNRLKSFILFSKVKTAVLP